MKTILTFEAFTASKKFICAYYIDTDNQRYYVSKDEILMKSFSDLQVAVNWILNRIFERGFILYHQTV